MAQQSILQLLVPRDKIQLSLDSMTAVAFINQMCSTRFYSLNALALQMWQQVLHRGPG